MGFIGVSQGSWEVLGEPLGVLGRPFVILGVLGGSLGVLLVSLGVPRRSSERPRWSSGRGQKGPKTQKVLSECLGWGLGRHWGDFGRLGWSLGPTQGVQMLIFRWF